MVEQSHLGLALGFPVWTVEFDGMCSFAEEVWGPCPANTGDLQVSFSIYIVHIIHHTICLRLNFRLDRKDPLYGAFHDVSRWKRLG